jgi:hypothetical protein
MLKLSKAQVLGIVRHALTFIGGALISIGIVDDVIFTEITGGVITLVGAVWSIVEKNKK